MIKIWNSKSFYKQASQIEYLFEPGLFDECFFCDISSSSSRKPEKQNKNNASNSLSLILTKLLKVNLTFSHQEIAFKINRYFLLK